MATLPTQVVGLAGTANNAINFSAAAAGDKCATGEDVILLVKNGAGSSITVTLATPGRIDGDLDITDRVVTVAAGATEGIRVTDRYRDPATGLAAITYSSTTTVTSAVIR